MFIVPMADIDPAQFFTPIGGGQNTQEQKGVTVPFADIFHNAVENMKETKKISDQDTVNLVAGNMDDLAQMMINAEKADAALQVVLQLRGKALDAYNEIMRMGI